MTTPQLPVPCVRIVQMGQWSNGCASAKLDWLCLMGESLGLSSLISNDAVLCSSRPGVDPWNLRCVSGGPLVVLQCFVGPGLHTAPQVRGSHLLLAGKPTAQFCILQYLGKILPAYQVQIQIASLWKHTMRQQYTESEVNAAQVKTCKQSLLMFWISLRLHRVSGNRF